MISQFDIFIQNLFLEAGEQPADPALGAPPQGGTEGGAPDAGGEQLPEEPPVEDLAPDEPTFPEEIELAKLAIRAIYFNIDSKNTHNLKMRIGNNEIPFEMVSDYFEKTKNIIPVLSFVEWVMDKYEGSASKWTEDPEIRGKSIAEKLKAFKKLPKEQQLDNGKRVYWTRIILNGLLRGSPNFNINISDVNEKTIKEIFRLLKQNFGTDTRGTFAGLPDMNAPGTF